MGSLLEDGLSYKESFIVRCYEVGINKTATANLLQEVGCNHAQSVGFSTDGFATTTTMRKLGLIWVTNRMHIEIYKYPAWGDVVETETWCQDDGRIGTRRDWVLKDLANGEVIGRATSKWVMMNQNTRRLQRVSDEVRDEVFVHCPKTLSSCNEIIHSTQNPKLQGCKYKERNQAKIDANCSKIQEALKSLEDYKRTCELHGVSYYDSFKLQREVHDFNANVRRLELAGLWDEIIEMLRRRELPDAFEGREEWVNLGTLYRRLVEPLDIANYYRHSKNEDTGSYLSKGRPRRYKYTQKWHEQLQRIPFGSSLESCFWAMSEELQTEMINGKSFEDLKDRVARLESDTLGWFTSGNLGKDVFLTSSSFVIWWKTLPNKQRSTSCIAKLMPP